MTDAMYVEDVGAGPPVLAIHGLGGGAHFFGGFARRLQRDYRVLSVDLPGTGRSPGTLSMDGWVHAVGSLLAERTAEPVVVLGHSMGTLIALKAWQAWPARIRGLVFVGGLPEVRPVIRQRLSQRVESLQTARNLNGWGPRISPGNFSPVTMRERPEIVAFFERLFEAQPVQTYVRCTRILLAASAVDVPPTISAPTLAVTGMDDQYAPPADVDAFVRQMPDRPTLEVLPDCGHLPFLERPDAFAAVVTAFLATCSNAARSAPRPASDP